MTPRSQLVRGLTAALALLSVTLGANSCGGGGGGSSPPPPPPQPLQIAPVNIPEGTANRPYNFTFSATGGTPPYTWSLAPGSSQLPTGLTLSSAGILSGTPPDPIVSPIYYNLIIQVSDAASRATSRGFGLQIYGLLRILTTSLAAGNVGVSYYQFLSAYGGRGPYTFTVAPGSPSLPTGITLDPSGTLSGIPDVSGNLDITFEVKDYDSSPQTATRQLNLNILNNLVVSTTQLSFGVVGQPFNQRVKAAGGTPPYTFSSLGGYLSAGLTLHPDGQITGTPTLSGSGGLSVQVTDSATPPATAVGYPQLFVRPVLAFVSTVLMDGIKDESYSSNVTLQGGTPPQSMRIISGTLPTGVRLDTVDTTNGLFYIRGTPTATGSTDLTLEASDSSSPPIVVTRTFTLRIFDRLRMTIPTLPLLITGDTLNVTFTAAGGLPPYYWATSALPSGLTLDSASGVLSGSPTVSFNGYVAVSLRDSSYPQQYTSQSAPMTIVGRLQIATTSLPPLMVGIPVDIALAASGGASTKIWSTVSGSLPAGLTFNNATGRITGTPTAAETTSITLRVDDAGPPAQTVIATLTLTSTSVIGRNDSIATATPLSNGTYLASLSPADDASGAMNPDNDYYTLAAAPGSIISVEITADRLVPKPSPMDSVIEILDFAGTRYTTCSTVTYGFYSPCMNDDISAGYTLDSKIYFQVPGTPGGAPVTFYVRVLDWSGMARPDFRYTITISGAN